MDPSAPFPTAVEALSAEPEMTQLAPAAPTHPPYPEMICSAITALKERDGSSRIAIAKYIDESFSGLPPNHSTLLTHHLKVLKNGGVVVMVKKSYKLRSDNNGDTSTNTNHVSLPDASGPKRGRGRPPKPKPDPAQVDPAQPVSASLGPVGESTEKRAPGRPRKSMSLAVVVEQGTDLPKRSPGRPRKYINGGPVVGPVLAKRRPGRPPGRKPKTIADVNRPKGKRRPGRPAKAQSMPLIVPYSTADVPKPRGRPKMVPVAAVNGLVKRRGRPPKVGGGEVKPKSATGRSPGRPKKNATPPVSEAAVELKKKLEYFQSKVMQIVEVLKPQLSAQSSVSAVTAVQELEGLATLDISAPLPVDAPIQAPVPVPVQVQVQQPALQNLEAVW